MNDYSQKLIKMRTNEGVVPSVSAQDHFKVIEAYVSAIKQKSPNKKRLAVDTPYTSKTALDMPHLGKMRGLKKSGSVIDNSLSSKFIKKTPTMLKS